VECCRDTACGRIFLDTVAEGLGVMLVSLLLGYSRHLMQSAYCPRTTIPGPESTID
jgi:hypothetical protein